MILTDGPKAIPFAPLPLEWLAPEMLHVIPASPAHLWTYLWSLTEHQTGTLPKGRVYTHLEAAQKLAIDERSVRRWFVAIEQSGWMESVRLRNGLRYRLRRVPPPGQPTGAQRTPESVLNGHVPDRERTPESVVTPERTSVSVVRAPERTAESARTDSAVHENGHLSPLPKESERFRDSEGGGGPAAAVVGGGQDSTPAQPPPVDRPPPVTPPASKTVEGNGGDYVAQTERAASALREYLGNVPLDPGVRQMIAYELHDHPLARQREILLTAAASFKQGKQGAFAHLMVPDIWKDRIREATAKVEVRQRHRDAALWQGYDPGDARYPAPDASEAARQKARAYLARKAPTCLASWDPTARRTIPVPVSLRPVADSFVTVKEALAEQPERRAQRAMPPGASAERGAEGDAA